MNARTLDGETLQRFLASVLGQPVTIVRIVPLGEVLAGGSGKTYGYGKPVRIDYAAGGRDESVVFHTASPNPFGHEHMADRAQAILWAHEAFGRLTAHPRSLGVGVIRPDGEIASLGPVEEFCHLTEYVPGRSYHLDLERLRGGGELTGTDLARADALCDYLLGIHRKRGGEPGLYTRRVRELVGSGECIMGLADSYPADGPIAPAQLEQIERLCVAWRWKLKPLSHRLRQVHGDFHPWNILFEDSGKLHVLDRSRGEWGDPADDVVCLSSNYLFFSLQRYGDLRGPFQELFQRFWKRYLDAAGDGEMLRVAAPYFAFRGLVMAHPLWYPRLAGSVRRTIFNFIDSVLHEESFHPEEVNHYCAARASLRRMGNGSARIR